MTPPGELAMFLAIEEMRARVTDEADDLSSRLAEVEERLDFAERLLAHGRQADQLPGGAHR